MSFKIDFFRSAIYSLAPMKILCVIPSRLHSTRLPRKALLPIQGKPMIQWTYENAMRSSLLTEVVVATDSEEIAEVIQKIEGKVVMTDSHLANGSLRVAKAAESYPDMNIIINLQGDEPFIKPAMLDELISPYLRGDSPDMTTLAYPLTPECYEAPSVVKVITDLNNNAIYFSRSPIPYYRNNDSTPVPAYHHMGLYAFKREFLMRYKELAPTPLEKMECLEQLRVLEHGYKIKVCFTKERTLEINTKEEYAQAQTFEYRL